MKEFLTFRKMVSPVLIQIAFWLAIVFILYTAITDFLHNVGLLMVVEVLILGPLVARVVCEILILFFRINDNLSLIKNELEKKQ